MGGRKYIEKKDAYTFHLVHRSRQDPEINNPEASDRVFKLVKSQNGKSRKELEEELGENIRDIRENEGEAANYGIYYDDTDYDYMQHIKPVGQSQGVLLSAPTRNNQNNDITDFLPKEVLPSAVELPKNYQSQQAIQDSIAGFKPDMDPNLREVLEALDDEAYIDNTGSDELGEAFFVEIAKSGKLDEEQFYEDSGGWESDTTGIETCDFLRSAKSISTKHKKTYGPKTATSGYSMSSSSMFRNEQLTLLDDRFEQIEREYDCESEEDYNSCVTEEQFNSIMDDFLKNEIKPKANPTALSELDSIRKSLGKARIY